MPRSFSITARQSIQDPASGDTPVLLVTITHEDLDEPVHLASDYTERLSNDPLILGVQSRGVEYPFAVMSAIWPDDQSGAPPTTDIAFANIAPNMARVVRSVRTQASVKFEMIVASSPDFVEQTFTGLMLVRSTYNSERVTLSLSQVGIAGEPYPAERTSRSRFPGMYLR